MNYALLDHESLDSILRTSATIVTFVFKDVTLIFFALTEYERHVRNVIKKFNEENLNYCSFLKD